jgi:hypothetical protein
MEPEVSLPHLQVPAICTSHEPARSSPYPPNLTSRRSILILFSTYTWIFQVVSYPQISPPKPLLSPTHVTCPIYLIILDLITRTILGEGYRSLSTSLCSFLTSSVISSLLHPNILLSTLKHLLPQCERPSFTPVQNNRQNYSSVGLNLYICGANWKTKNLHRMCGRACQASICLTCTSTHTLNWKPPYLFSLTLLCWFVSFVLILSSP